MGESLGLRLSPINAARFWPLTALTGESRDC
jgi:hypothetical protein